MKGRNDNSPSGSYSETDIDLALHAYADRQLPDDPVLLEAVRQRLERDPEAERKVREIREINAAIRAAFPHAAGAHARFSGVFGQRFHSFMRSPLTAGVAATLAALIIGFFLGRQSDETRTADKTRSQPAPVVRLDREAASSDAVSVSRAMAPSGNTSAEVPAFPSIPASAVNPEGHQGS